MKSNGTASYGAKTSTPSALASYAAKGKGLPAKAGTEVGQTEGLDALVDQTLAMSQLMQGLLGKMPQGKGKYDATKAPEEKGLPFGEGVIVMYLGAVGRSNYLIVGQYFPGSQQQYAPKKSPSDYDVQ